MKEKKELTPSQKQRRFALLEWGTFVGQFIALIMPFFVIGLVNYDKYFVQYNGTKVSLAFFIAMGVLGFTVMGVTKWKIKDKYIALIIKYVLIALCFTFLGEIIRDIASIMWFGLIGLVMAYGLNKASKHYEEEKMKYVEGNKEAEKEEIKEQIKQERLEKKQKKIKVRVRK